jgi:hypothetical protein
MRSASLFAVLALVFVLAVSSFSPVAAVGGITIVKATTNGDTTTMFHLTISGPFSGSPAEWDIPSGDGGTITGPAGVYTVIEEVPLGWVLTVRCDGFISTYPWSTFEYITGGVIITYVAADIVGCKFINSPETPPVGGVVIPANTLALVAPWLAVIGLVGCIGTVVVVAKKRRQ